MHAFMILTGLTMVVAPDPYVEDSAASRGYSSPSYGGSYQNSAPAPTPSYTPAPTSLYTPAPTPPPSYTPAPSPSTYPSTMPSTRRTFATTTRPLEFVGPSTLSPIEANGAIPGALIAGGVTLAGAAVGGLVGALVHNSQVQPNCPGPHCATAKYSYNTPVSLLSTSQSMLVIGGLCSLVAAAAVGFYIRRRRSQPRLGGIDSASDDEEVDAVELE